VGLLLFVLFYSSSLPGLIGTLFLDPLAPGVLTLPHRQHGITHHRAPSPSAASQLAQPGERASGCSTGTLGYYAYALALRRHLSYEDGGLWGCLFLADPCGPKPLLRWLPFRQQSLTARLLGRDQGPQQDRLQKEG
jgi:hypothetical protein